MRFSSEASLANVQQQLADVLGLKLLRRGYFLMKACSMPFGNLAQVCGKRVEIYNLIVSFNDVAFHDFVGVEFFNFDS